MNPLIFREYDIRGVEGKDLTQETVELLGKGIGTYYAQRGIRNITLARDCRLSSPPFHDAILKGLLSCGMEVTDLGVTPTPLLYFSIVHLKKEGGVMITGSHNPPEFNGFKVCVGKDAIYGEEIQRIRRIIEGGKFATGEGVVTTYEIIRDYQGFLLNDIKLSKGLKVVIDAGNGTAGVVAAPVMRELGCEVTELYCEMDGHFPNHHPDPTVEAYMQDLIRTVKELRADVGIGYDGDGLSLIHI